MLLDNFTVRSQDENMNRMVNIWNQYQCMVTFNLARSASYFESGISRGIGFRDSNQDILGVVHMIPDRARERILDLAATQFEDGSSYHQYEPISKKGNDAIGSGFNDDPLWLIMSTAAYIKKQVGMTFLKKKFHSIMAKKQFYSIISRLRFGMLLIIKGLMDYL